MLDWAREYREVGQKGKSQLMTPVHTHVHPGPVQDITGTPIRLISYNIQVGIASNRPLHYVTRGWRHLLPHAEHFTTLDQIAHALRGFDIVGLQEVDAGSLRSSFVNQTEYLAARGGFKYWHYQTNRRIANLARHSNGLLSHLRPFEIVEHKLPGRVPGRGAIVAKFGTPENPLVVVMLHLALGKRARTIQLDYVADAVKTFRHVVVMGDLNCQPQSDELIRLIDKTGLIEPAGHGHTYPSWRPSRKLDHILVAPSLLVSDTQVHHLPFSDHLPISVEIIIPAVARRVA